MKLNQSTTILINVLLVLFVAVLVKSFFYFPKAVSAAPNKSYQVVTFNFSDYIMQHDRPKGLQDTLNKKAAEGWSLVSYIPGQIIYLVFER
jgi:hypothetical protein